MNAAASAARNPFDPPRTGGLGRALALALVAHLLLVLALTWGLRWNKQPQNMAVAAELWSPTVQRAAPRPPPTPPPQPQPRPQPQPEVQTPPPPPQPTAEQRDAEIALEQQKKREAEQRLLAEQQERQRKEREQAEARERERQERQLAEKKAAEKKAAEEAQRKEQLAKAEAAKKAEAEKQRAEEARKDNIRRAAALAAADGEGQDERNAGPSGDYAARISALVYDNLVFIDKLPGDPVVEVEVRTGPTGLIISRRITRSSGVKAWDDAALRALDRTGKLPSDQGRYWNPMLITFRYADAAARMR